MSTSHAWFVRHKGKIEGPFPAGQIKQSILVGRYKADAEVSHDKENWQPIRKVRALIPDVLLADRSDENAKERLAAARRWADERRMERRQDKRSEANDRRSTESYETMEYRHSREATLQLARRRRNQWSALAGFLLVLGGVIFAAFYWVPAEQGQAANCAAPAAPGVNWSHCRMAGYQALSQNLNNAILESTDLSGANLFGSNLQNARLAYADLSGSHLRLVDLSNAKLKGTSLRNADLTQANFRQADLSYADLRDSILQQTDFSGAILDNAIWEDGRTCRPGSVGKCK